MNSAVITSVVGGRFTRGPSGTTLFIDAQPASSASGGTLKAYKVQSEGDNHLSVKLWEDGAESGSALNVAKPPYLRIASKPGDDHVISPAYTSAIIYCMEVDGGTDVEVSEVPLNIMDINVDARKWGLELFFCDSNVAKSATVDMGAVSTV